MTETVVIKKYKDDKAKITKIGHNSKSYNEIESKTPPLSEAHLHSIEELIKQRKILKKELDKVSEVIDEKKCNKRKQSTSLMIKKQKEINEKLCKITVDDDLDSENEDLIISQRRAKRKLLIENFCLSPSDDKIPPPAVHENTVEEIRSSDHMMASSQYEQSSSIPDMFSEFDTFETGTRSSLPNLKKSHCEPVNNWDDTDGYYKIVVGDIINENYIVTSILGQGVFANVVRAKSKKTKGAVAIKIIRQNDLMYQTSLKEVNFLKEIRDADPTSKYNCIKFIENFRHRGHLCIVLEVFHMNLRSALKTYGRTRGLKLKAVRCYSMQILKALRFLKRHGIIHCDIKPDNILLNEKSNIIRLCDFGSATKIDDADITPYLVSRFYRAPEIIIGLPYDYGVDIWSAACTMFEMATGRILFTGSSNNEMLKAMIDIKGKFPVKLVRKGKFKSSHFNLVNNFILHKEYKGKERQIEIMAEKPSKDFLHELNKFAGDTYKDDNKQYQLKDLLENMTIFDSKLRYSATDAFTHPFIQDSFE